MHHAWNNDPVYVAENFLEWLALLGCVFWKSRADCAGLLIRRNLQLLDVFTKIRNPVSQLMELFAKFLRRRVTYFS